MEEVDKGYCEFCITVGTVARTAGILIHSQLKALAVNLSWPFGRLRLYAGSVGSNNPRWLKADLVVCENSSFSSWVWAGEFFFCYQLTRVVPDEGPLNGVCVCVCVYQVVDESGVTALRCVAVHTFQPGTESSSQRHTGRPFVNRMHSCCVELSLSTRL